MIFLNLLLACWLFVLFALPFWDLWLVLGLFLEQPTAFSRLLEGNKKNKSERYVSLQP